MKAMFTRLSSPNPEWGRVLLIAASLGLAAGLLEGAILSAISMAPSLMTWQMVSRGTSSEILWIAPLCYLLLFVSLAPLLVTIGKWRTRLPFFPNITVEALAIFLFASLCFYAAVYAPGRMHSWAAIVLSLGLGVQAGRWFLRSPEIVMSLLRRSLPVLMLLVIAAAGATTGVESLREAASIRRLPPAKAGAPNVLLIVLDTTRADHLSCYGYDRATTPNIDALARGGLRFENAFSTSSWTLPSHISLLTGRHYYEDYNDGPHPGLSKEGDTLAEALANQGYATGGFSANTTWVTSISGFDRGFHRFEDYFGSVTDMIARTIYGKEFQRRILSRFGYRDIWGRKRASDINRALVDWLDDRQDRPFFVFLNFLEPHTPYVSPPPYHTRFMNENQRAKEGKVSFLNRAVFRGPAEVPQLWTAAYDGALNYLDAELGKLFEDLQRRNVLDNTLVVLTSDHGEAFGEHGLYDHGHSLYHELIHVPLVLRFPGRIPNGATISRPVSLRDVPATILSILGLPQTIPGVSLEASWGGENPESDSRTEPVYAELSKNEGGPDSLPTSSGWIKSVVTAQWHFIMEESGQVELYDRLEDPKQTRNIADTQAAMSVVQEFRTQLQKRNSSSISAKN